jgi:TatD DNase family protein
MIFETHAHYDHARFNNDRDAVIESLPKSGIGCVINAATDVQSAEEGLRLSEKYPFMHAAVGVHPHCASSLSDEGLERIKELCSHPKCVAVGEIGLDFHYGYSPREAQRLWFKRQLELALEVSLPVIIHSREAANECFQMIKDSGVRKGVIHCYSGSAEMALDYVKMGFYIGVGGILTFDNARKLVEVCEALPLDRIVLETDAPFLAPVPHRKDRNDSRYLKFVAEKLSVVKNVEVHIVEKTTFNNAKLLFNVSL